MANDDRQRHPPTGKTDTAPKKAPAEPPFDAWLRKQLHEMYDEIAREPLPASILDLIEKDAVRTGKAPSGASKTPRDNKK